ncbi:MAG TPA: arylsulfotransferase family protein [Solirubrobacteraceae bacterium]|nr:arylsulfotransferase family protein [Solirubrobacteraceae bacterium]
MTAITAAALTAAAILAILLLAAGRSRAAGGPVDVFPIPGARFAAPSTQITFRGIPASQFGAISVTGSVSGTHTGRVMSDSDGHGGSFLPAKHFKEGEKVTVKTGMNIVGGSGGTYTFNVAIRDGGIPPAPPQTAPRVRGDLDRFQSAPQLFAPALTVRKLPHGAAPGDLFVGPQAGPVQRGPEIFGPYGGLIWFKSVPKGQSAADFRVQTYRRRSVLTWWQGGVNGGVGVGTDEIYDRSYRPVATVKGVNGIQADLHEFQITPQNTALITGYFPVYVNASKIKGGSKHQLVYDSVAQEIDIATGLVVWQWDSLDHVPLNASYQFVPPNHGHPWDYFHINSIQQAPDGNIVISGRNTWSITDASHTTAGTVWTLGGKLTTFKMGPNTPFAFQHDARLHANGVITLFDDGAGPPIVHKRSRGITLKLDTANKAATLVLQDEHQPGILAEFEGNVQNQPNGNQVVGWGGNPYITEFNNKGRPVFDAHFVGANTSYRAYRFVWNATPKTRPSAALHIVAGKAIAYASWNGATAVTRWQVLGGSAPSKLSVVASARKAAFETAIKLPKVRAYVEVRALDARGHMLGTSRAVKVTRAGH